jgi:hypothetical protein
MGLEKILRKLNDTIKPFGKYCFVLGYAKSRKVILGVKKD